MFPTVLSLNATRRSAHWSEKSPSCYLPGSSRATASGSTATTSILPKYVSSHPRSSTLIVAQSVASHRLPVFSGITLCISGITDIVRRTKINKALTSRGGTYVKALERPVRVTHLLCSGEEETDKMRYAEKFNRAGEADPPIQLVWEEWFWDCVEYGGSSPFRHYRARP
jgi:hypothetical protein